MNYLEIERTYEEFNKLSVLLNKLEQSGLDDSRIIVSLNSLNPTHYSDIDVNMIYKKAIIPITIFIKINILYIPSLQQNQYFQ